MLQNLHSKNQNAQCCTRAPLNNHINKHITSLSPSVWQSSTQSQTNLTVLQSQQCLLLSEETLSQRWKWRSWDYKVGKKKDFLKSNSGPGLVAERAPSRFVHKQYIQIIQVAATPLQRGVVGGEQWVRVGRLWSRREDGSITGGRWEDIRLLVPSTTVQSCLQGRRAACRGLCGACALFCFCYQSLHVRPCLSPSLAPFPFPSSSPVGLPGSPCLCGCEADLFSILNKKNKNKRKELVKWVSWWICTQLSRDRILFRLLMHQQKSI